MFLMSLSGKTFCTGSFVGSCPRGDKERTRLRLEQKSEEGEENRGDRKGQAEHDKEAFERLNGEAAAKRTVKYRDLMNTSSTRNSNDWD